jgi:DNA-directed RNA polymerase specialized sigma24 family protein
MAASLAAAIAEVEGPEFDAIVGYAVPLPKAAPTDAAVEVAFKGLTYAPFGEIARKLASRYRCHRADAEDAVQDGLVELREKRPDLFREKPENWLGLLHEIARFRLIEIKEGQERTASIEELAERAGEAPFYGARPCIPLALEGDEVKYVPLAREGKEWSREQIIGALQRFRDHYGRPPRARDCRALHGLPSPATIHRHFRSLAEAILAAGMVPDGLGQRRRRWSASEAAEACASFRRRQGYWPGWIDVKRRPGELPGPNAMVRFFGGTRPGEVQVGAEAILWGGEGAG